MIHDHDSFTGDINDTNSEALSITSTKAAYIYLTLDDGTEGNSPAQYDIVVKKDPLGIGGTSRLQYVLDETGRTDRSWRFEAVGGRMVVEITNTSGSTANYEMEVEARGGV
jgi:hypothetical protein